MHVRAAGGQRDMGQRSWVSPLKKLFPQRTTGKWNKRQNLKEVSCLLTVDRFGESRSQSWLECGAGWLSTQSVGVSWELPLLQLVAFRFREARGSGGEEVADTGVVPTSSFSSPSCLLTLYICDCLSVCLFLSLCLSVSLLLHRSFLVEQ